MKASVIVPCYNSMPILRTMVEETIKVLKTLPIEDYEFVLVNDCSPRLDTIDFLKSIADEFQCVKVINLAKNTGQANAQIAALHYVTGDIVINMDDDMQTHPKNIPALFEKLMEGYDLVLGRYPQKRHSFYRRMLTWMDDKFETCFLNKPKQLSFTSFWIARRYITDKIAEYNAPYSFLEGLFLRTAGRIANADVEHFERTEGKSGYNLGKLFKLWSNFTGFTILPLRIAGMVGSTVAIGAFIWMIILVIRKICGDVMMGYSSIMCLLLLSFGVTLCFIGLLGEYIGRVFMCVNQTPQFVVKDIYNRNGGQNNG